jgi:hypothetical protein
MPSAPWPASAHLAAPQSRLPLVFFCLQSLAPSLSPLPEPANRIGDPGFTPVLGAGPLRAPVLDSLEGNTFGVGDFHLVEVPEVESIGVADQLGERWSERRDGPRRGRYPAGHLKGRDDPSPIGRPIASASGGDGADSPAFGRCPSLELLSRACLLGPGDSLHAGQTNLGNAAPTALRAGPRSSE